MAHYDIFRDQLAIAHPSLGHALWEPQPGRLFPPVEVGDVGFISYGGFLRLFNVLLPRDHPSQAIYGVPENFEPLQLPEQEHIERGTLCPGNLCSYGITLPSGGSEDFESGATGPSETPFSCTRKHGAVLSLPVTSHCEDTRLRVDFGQWIIANIDSWFAFTYTYGFGVEMEDIILVTGRHRTTTWSGVGFTCNESPGVAAASALGARVHWRDLILRIPGSMRIQGPIGENLPEDQCIFIRGFRIKRTAKRKPDSWKGMTEDESMCVPGIEIPEHHDPLDLLLDYIIKRVPSCDMALVHDDDLEQILRVIDQTSMEMFQPDMLMDHLEKSRPGIVVMSDSLPTNNQSRKVAMFSAGFPPVAQQIGRNGEVQLQVEYTT